VLPAAQLKIAAIDYLLQEQLDSVLTEPLPHQWSEIIRQLQQESQASNSQGKHNTQGRKFNRTSGS
jgi:hypothetical protein